MEDRVVIAKGEGLGGWIGSLRLIDTSYYIESRQAIRSYCVVQGTVFNIL